jgi:SAM-dependent methyltransferase
MNAPDPTAVLARPGAPQAPGEKQAWDTLHEQASARYRNGGRFAWHFARGKLGRDPVFRALLGAGLLPPGARVLDIGCGQALLASLLAACDTLAERGQWPRAWHAPPTLTRYTGIELMARDVARAQAALAGLPRDPQVRLGDMRDAAFESCDVAVVLDVLHYVDIAAQDAVLTRVRDALAPRGRLLLRVGDASRRLRFAASQWVDRLVTAMRGHRAAPTWGRTLAQWITVLQALGFVVRPWPMSQGTPFANVLLVCELGSRSEVGAVSAPGRSQARIPESTARRVVQ